MSLSSYLFYTFEGHRQKECSEHTLTSKSVDYVVNCLSGDLLKLIITES